MIYTYNRTATSVLAIKTPHESLFGPLPSKPRLRTYGCSAYAHRYESHRADKFDDWANIRLYTGTREGLPRLYFGLKRKLISTKPAVFDETAFSLDDPTDSAVGGITGNNDMLCTLQSETEENDDDHFEEPQQESRRDAENDDTEQISRQTTSISGEDLEQKVQNERRFPDKERYPPQRFTANALVRRYSDDESSMCHALNA